MGIPQPFSTVPAAPRFQTCHRRDYQLSEARNANTCGAYLTSHRTNEIIAEARAAMADFFGSDPDESFSAST